MRILAIETSTPVVSVAVEEDETITGEVAVQTTQGHMETLLPLLDQLLSRLQLSVRDIDAFAVGAGPGSFTSLRIGMATAKALAHSLGKPLYGVPTLDLLALGLKGTPGLICPLLTARRDEIYACFYVSTPTGMKRLSNYLALPPEELGVRLQAELRAEITFVGEGAVSYRKYLQSVLGDRAFMADPVNNWPRAGMAARLGREQMQTGQPSDPAAIHPIYVKQPAIRRK
jgi:tRNA threonylcarbamoyladenosine biosynthesis protein TsaB